MSNCPFMITLFALNWILALSSLADAEDLEASRSKVILVHYMPWFEANPAENRWGWHWTMNAFHPEKKTDGIGEIASKFHPVIGPYDSGDPWVIEYHLLLIKLAGIDGVIVDWYGLEQLNDYPLLHRNTERLIERAEKMGIQFAICYEDQTLKALESAGKISQDNRVKHVQSEIEWLDKHWFRLNGYVKYLGKPVLLSFGHEGLRDVEWERCLQGLKSAPLYISQHHRRIGAAGTFDWPLPKEGIAATERYCQEKANDKNAGLTISCAYPRFVDIYEAAKVHASWGTIEDHQGKTFQRTLKSAFASKSRWIQLVTWNDWGEGTQIEPSVEYGTRDLALIQELRRKQPNSKFTTTQQDLELPRKLLELRRQNAADEKMQLKLDSVADLLTKLRCEEALEAMNRMKDLR